MKNINKFAFVLTHMFLVGLLLLTIGCDDDTWDNHYNSSDARLEYSIMDVLSKDPDLTRFVELLKETGNDTVLAYSQAHTVWAPDNTALESLSDDILNDEFKLKQFINNHIGQFSYNSSSIDEPVFVKMLNNKYVEFVKSGSDIMFGDVAVTETDLLASNGIVHKLDDKVIVNPNIWGTLNERELDFPIMMDFLNQFNETVFDEENSVVIGRNSLGQNVYDSIFVDSNSHFDIVGQLDSEERRYTTIGITDDAYTTMYNEFEPYFFHPVSDTIVKNTNNMIFDNFNFHPFEAEDMNGYLFTTTGSSVKLDAANVVEDVPLSNGNLLVMSELGYDPRDLFYKSSRYEIEDDRNRVIGSEDDMSIIKRYDLGSSGTFYNVVSLNKAPDATESNNYFEVNFSDVVVGEYKINIKFRPIGASQSTKLKFEFTYPYINGFVIKRKIGPIVVSNTQEEILEIGDPYLTYVHVGNAQYTNYPVKLKVFVDVTEPELVLYDRTFGIDYVELVPVEPIVE